MQTTETYDSSLEEKSSKGDRWDDSACGAQVKLSRTRSCRVEFVCGREKENRGPAPRLERTRPDIREVGLETGEGSCSPRHGEALPASFAAHPESGSKDAPLWASRFARGVGNKECRSSTPSGSILVRGTRPFSTGGILLVVATPTQLCPPVRSGGVPGSFRASISARARPSAHSDNARRRRYKWRHYVLSSLPGQQNPYASGQDIGASTVPLRHGVQSQGFVTVRNGPAIGSFQSVPAFPRKLAISLKTTDLHSPNDDARSIASLMKLILKYQQVELRGETEVQLTDVKSILSAARAGRM
ncbi:hypothetical protein DFH06DRAFT_1146419 [Mycena polygramma]|nr:hypothetical protein DFH06DRAFT_1146419 [Mycena polygramma]